MNFLRCLFGCFSFILSFFGIILLFAVDMKYKVYPAIIALLFGYMSYRVFKKGKEKENSLVSSISESHISQVLTDNAGLEEAALSTAIVEKERRKVPVDLLSNFPIKQTNISKIPKEILELLWIKDVNYTCSDSMILEPSLIDSKLEIIEDTYLLAHPLDIGYYPSYANLSPGQRFVYLNWLTDITQPIPIGYVFIFYYGLERHLISGNFEAAFNMIVKLRNYHTNQSFYSYSSEAMLISLLQHKRHDLISHIDLNKANPKLVQFVLATLTGGIDSVTLIENCREVQFTNKRYINDCYELFKQTLEDILNEKYGVSYYPVDSEMFFNCTNTFPLILANFSLNTKDRLVAAPDLISNRTYLNDVYNLLSETHEKVKAYRREQRKEQTVSKKQKNLLLSSEEKVSELQQLYSDVEAEYNQLISTVKYNSSTAANFPFNENEEIFFKALIKAMKENKLWNKENLRLTRLANKAINVDCKSCHIGKIKLQENETFMQVFRGISQVKVFSDKPLEFYLEQIPAWIRYIKYCRRS